MCQSSSKKICELWPHILGRSHFTMHSFMYYWVNGQNVLVVNGQWLKYSTVKWTKFDRCHSAANWNNDLLCCVQDGEEYDVRRCLKARSFNLALCISFSVVLLIFILTVLVIITLVREFYEYLLLWVSDVIVALFPGLLQFRLPLFCTARYEKLGRAWEQG